MDPVRAIRFAMGLDRIGLRAGGTPGSPPSTCHRIPGSETILIRIRRRILRAVSRATRARDSGGLTAIGDLSPPSYIYMSSPAADLVCRIGNPQIAGLPEPSLRVRQAADSIIGHTFDLLGSGPREVRIDRDADPNWEAAFSMLTEGLPEEYRRQYVPIDWHVDFVSGHRWDPQESFLDVRVAPVPNTEIKIPRELSRFQHVGALAHGGSERDGIEFLLQTADWIAANPVRRGVNWASTMDVAIRAVNWLWGLRLLAQAIDRFPRSVAVILQALHEHGRHIEDNLDFYEEAATNHYLANVAGLLYIGACCPAFPEADRWVHFGIQELVSEMEREVYPDGADFEASTHYHRLVAEIFLSSTLVAQRLSTSRRAGIAGLELRAWRRAPRLYPLSALGVTIDLPQVFPEWYLDRLNRMVGFTSALTKQNGLVPQFGDNDSGRLHKLDRAEPVDVRDHRHLCAVGGRLFGRVDLMATGAPSDWEGELLAGGLQGIPSRAEVSSASKTCHSFPHAGLVVLRNGPAYLAITCGPNGQNGRGGHGHNDKGAFDLSIGADDFVADGGSLAYTSNVSLRNAFRSSQAHSTAWVKDREQEPLPPGLGGLFHLPERVFRRLEVIDEGTVVCEHHGYDSIHRRTFSLTKNKLNITDELSVEDEWRVGLNLDPSVGVEVRRDGRAWMATLVHDSGRRVEVRMDGVSALVVRDGFFSRAFGVRVENRQLVGTAAEERVVSTLTWD